MRQAGDFIYILQIPRIHTRRGSIWVKVNERSKEKTGKNIERGTCRDIYLERKMGDERQKTYGE